MTTVSPMIARPQLPPRRLLWMNTMIDSNSVIRGENAFSMTLARIGMRCGGSVVGCYSSVGCGTAAGAPAGAGEVPDPNHSLGLHRIVTAVATGVAPQQSPTRENQAPK